MPLLDTYSELKKHDQNMVVLFYTYHYENASFPSADYDGIINSNYFREV